MGQLLQKDKETTINEGSVQPEVSEEVTQTTEIVPISDAHQQHPVELIEEAMHLSVRYSIFENTRFFRI